MNIPDKLKAARDMFTHTQEMLQSIYGKQIPFVLIYVHENAEMLTNIEQEKAKKLLERAMSHIVEPPQHLKH